MRKPPIFIALLATLTGCGQTQDADLIIELVADPTINTEQQVAEQLVTIEMLFDAEGGFKGVNDNNPKVEGFQTPDPDDDGEVELLRKMDVRNRKTLPTVGLNAGSNTNTRIAVRVRGLDAEGQVAAFGGIPASMLFASEGPNEVEVPLNLSRTHLPPRIVALAPLVLPREGTPTSIAFYTSSPLHVPDLQENVRVWAVPSAGGGDEEVSGTVTGPTLCPFGTLMYTFTPNGCHLSSHWLSGVKLTVGTGVLDSEFSATISVEQIKEFGPACTPRMPCDQVGFDAPGDTDMVCNIQTGLFEPAPCSVVVAGCRPGEVFDWVPAAGTPECQQYRQDSIHLGGACVVLDPWPCAGQNACANVGTGTCDDGIGQCIPDACTDTCANDVLACMPGEGCLPKLGGCNQDCQSYGSCPEFDQACVLVESGGHACH